MSPEPSECLSEGQVTALEKIYSGTRNPRTGEMIYYADARGAEEEIATIYGDTERTARFDIFHWALPPERTSESFDFDRDMETMDDAVAKDVNAMDPDLSKFVAHGGKIILVHGWEDGLVSPLDTLDYYQRMTAAGHAKSEYSRLFLVPAMQHCFGGTSGPGAVGQMAAVGSQGSPDNDLVMALDHWVTTGVAPEQVLGIHLKSFDAMLARPNVDLTPIATRPVCAYPRIAKFDGKGDPKKASSFSCVKAKYPAYSRPADKYLR